MGSHLNGKHLSKVFVLGKPSLLGNTMGWLYLGGNLDVFKG
jgi:hypothetical protein